MASKNICSEGYTQFPLLSFPLSTSLFAGPSLGVDVARGIVEISRSVPRPSRDRSRPGERILWSIWEESQLSPAGMGRGDVGDEEGGRGCGIGGPWPVLRACSSHASRD